jgi:DNA-directed RNA polymerase subunit H (RpoH/RPB5)
MTGHHLFVPHLKIPPTEYDKHFRTLDSIPQLPKIVKSDPVVRFYAFERNDVLQIRRKDGSIAYRLVK